MVTYPTTTTTAGVILNRVAAEVGLTPVADPFSSADASFVQLTHLLNTAGEELAVLYDWQNLRREHNITTTAVDTGTDYALPTDFSRIVDNTAWNKWETINEDQNDIGASPAGIFYLCRSSGDSDYN